MKGFSYRAAVLGCSISLFLIITCCRDYAWQAAFEDSVNAGLSEVGIVSHEISINSIPFDYCIPGEKNTVNLHVRNPDGYLLECALAVSGSDSIVNPTVSRSGAELFAIDFIVDRAALGRTLDFTASLSAPAEGRAFPDYRFSLPCQYPAGTGVEVTVSLPKAASGLLAFTPPQASVPVNAASFAIGASPSLALPSGTVWAWYVDGVVQAGYAISSYRFNATQYAVGSHSLSATADDGANRLSGSMVVTVISVVPAPLFSVVYDAAGGTAVPAAAMYAAGTSVPTALNAGTKTGYAFRWWTTTDIAPGGAVTTYSLAAPFAMPGRNVLLTAVWEPVHAPVTLLSAMAGSGSVGLAWTDPDSPALSHINVVRFPTGNESLSVTLSVPVGAEGALVTGLTNGTGYTFRVYAVYSDNISSVYLEQAATPAVP